MGTNRFDQQLDVGRHQQSRTWNNMEDFLVSPTWGDFGEQFQSCQRMGNWEHSIITGNMETLGMLWKYIKFKNYIMHYILILKWLKYNGLQFQQTLPFLKIEWWNEDLWGCGTDNRISFIGWGPSPEWPSIDCCGLVFQDKSGKRTTWFGRIFDNENTKDDSRKLNQIQQKSRKSTAPEGTEQPLHAILAVCRLLKLPSMLGRNSWLRWSTLLRLKSWRSVTSG